ncbi:MAG TPA: hypothetical protein H9684_01890 [Firmicutes bacterium]|nr:hypothetical protein [Bacillota bacterium]
MRVIGLDIGTTTIAALALDGETGEVLQSRTVPNDAGVPAGNGWERLQDPRQIETLALGLVGELARRFAPVGGIGLTGQMHGILYLDREGRPVSPLYTWQDGRGDLPVEGGKSAAQALGERTGYSLASGFGTVTHYYNRRRGLVPAEAVTGSTIHGYLGMKLAGRKTPLLHLSDAAGWGLVSLEKGRFDEQAMMRAGLDPAFFPGIAADGAVLGETAQGIPVAPAVGDNQAAFLGAVRNMKESVLVNVGTGSQVSVWTPAPVSLPSAEARPCTEGAFLLVGSSLCGGRAYAALEGFYREAAAMAGAPPAPLYDAMEREAEACIGSAGRLRVDTRFSGTRQNPSLRGGIAGLGLDTLHPGFLTLGVLEGIVEELHGFYREMEPRLGRKPTALVGAGNGLRKNRLLQKLFSARFGLPLHIPVHREEAAYGAALTALVGAGAAAGIAETQALIRYQAGAAFGM